MQKQNIKKTNVCRKKIEKYNVRYNWHIFQQLLRKNIIVAILQAVPTNNRISVDFPCVCMFCDEWEQVQWKNMFHNQSFDFYETRS